ncbi:hypothetical protein KBC54_03270 [Patescibacteria group bacterium]|nr:hypothetical protein [Patescibacteria group bacterium]
MPTSSIRDKVIALRRKGESFSSINAHLGQRIPKSTLSNWCQNVHLPSHVLRQKHKCMLAHLVHARQKSTESKKSLQIAKTEKIIKDNIKLKNLIEQPDVAKISLVILYMCEGMKKANRASVTFGNSDPSIIRLFLHLLKICFSIDETRFRCTIQCRADQTPAQLETFWSKVTGIPQNQFYSTRIDERTRNRPSRNKSYHGVCRIDYFSADVFKELVAIHHLLTEGL